MATSFSPEQAERYARHIILPQVGGKGQRRLLESRVAVVGAGGLGAPVLLYLAAAGVGAIDVIDDDEVALSNLQRQVIHRNEDLGAAKTESAGRAIGALNPDVRVHLHRERLTGENAEELLRGSNIVVDGSDNFQTRYLVNDTTWRLRIPLVSGAMFRFEGQVSVYPQDGGEAAPCYRCLFPRPPEPGIVPSCAEAGILGAIPGVIGSIQATEVLKLLLGIGQPLIGRLLIFDGLEMSFRELRIKRNRRCAINGDAALWKANHGEG